MTFIYFAQIKNYSADRSGLVKIGRTKDPEKRMEQLGVSVGGGYIEIIRLLEATSNSDERRVQTAFKEFRVGREWFSFAPDMLTTDFELRDVEIPEPRRQALFREHQPAMTRAWRERRKLWRANLGA